MSPIAIANEFAEKLDEKRITPVPDDQPIPVADFFRATYMRSPSINGAGSHIAALVSGGTDKYQLMVIDVDEQDREIVRGGNNMDVYEAGWLSDDRIIFSLSSDKRYGVGLMVVPIRRLNRAIPIFQYGISEVVGVPREKPLRPLVWVRSNAQGMPRGVVELDAKRSTGGMIDLFQAGTGMTWSDVLEANSGAIKRTYPEPERGRVRRYMADRDGHLAYAVTMEGGTSYLHEWRDKTWHESPLDSDQWSILSAGNEPGIMVARSFTYDGTPSALHFLDVATGQSVQQIFQDDTYDVTGSIARDPGSGAVVGVLYHQAGPRSVWFDQTYATIQKALEGNFPGRAVRILDADENMRRVVVGVYSGRHPWSYHLIDLEKKSIDLIAESRPWLDPERMQRMRIMKYETAEGRKLDAYFVLPAGASKESPAPLVVMPHGGPRVRDTWGFHPEVQFLVSRGYAVLQPNYRGSPGYDWMFSESDIWDFLKMHDDVTRATKTMLNTGLVDPDRVAIAGGSFGGYLAVMGAVHEGDLYRCAVTFAGVFDWEEFLKTERTTRFDDLGYEVWSSRLGNPGTEAEKFERISPGRRVDQIDMPVFVVHGKDDSVVSVSESRRLLSELKRHAVPHESLLIGGVGHGTAAIEDSIRYYSELESFLAEHL